MKRKRFNEKEGRAKRRKRKTCEPGTRVAGKLITEEDMTEEDEPDSINAVYGP